MLTQDYRYRLKTLVIAWVVALLLIGSAIGAISIGRWIDAARGIG